jgi:hypothetical protein
VYTNNLGLEFIMKLKTATYNYKADANKRKQDGLIAQDVQKALKDLGLNFSGLVIDDDKDKTLNLGYAEFVLPLINAVQELNQQNQELKKKDSETKATLDEMKAEIQKLKQLIQNK